MARWRCTQERSAGPESREPAHKGPKRSRGSFVKVLTGGGVTGDLVAIRTTYGFPTEKKLAHFHGAALLRRPAR